MSSFSLEQQRLQKSLLEIQELLEKSVPEKYNHINFTPNAGMKSAAKRGLDSRKKAPKSQKGGLDSKQASREGIGSGVARARDILSGKDLSPATWKRVKSFFARHSAYKDKHRSDPSGPAKQSWDQWGGDAGESQSSSVVSQMEAADKKESETKKGFAFR